MLRLVGVLLLAAAAAAEHVEPTCRDLSCASKESLLHQIALLKKDVHSRDQVLADSTCTACYSNPCQNGGQCLPNGATGYRCDCPDDTSGTNCEKKIVCDSKTCGKNAHCFIQNHQTNCACEFGYSGNAKKGCSLATRKICFNGDPHYNTFDGAYYDYQSTCPYIFSMPCKDELANGYSTFSVKAKNDIQHPGDTVSMVSSTQVVFYNKTIFVDQFLHVFVDDVQVHVPYYYPSQSYAQFSVTLRNNDIVIKNDQFVEVDFHYGQLCMVIPDVPEFRGKETLCGLAGNFDGDCKDDLINELIYVNGKVYSYLECDSIDGFTDKDGNIIARDSFASVDLNHDIVPTTTTPVPTTTTTTGETTTPSGVEPPAPAPPGPSAPSKDESSEDAEERTSPGVIGVSIAALILIVIVIVMISIVVKKKQPENKESKSKSDSSNSSEKKSKKKRMSSGKDDISTEVKLEKPVKF